MSHNDLENDLEPSDRESVSSFEDNEKLAQEAAYDLPEPSETTVADEGSQSDRLDPVEAKSYLDDDEDWAAAADSIIHEDEASVIAQQDEALVSWDIQGLYDDYGKVRSKRSLRNNPPALVVSDSNGDTATFVLTKGLSAVLAKHMENTNRAYYGIRPKSERSTKEKLSDAGSLLKANLGKAIIFGGIILGLLIFGLFF